jgi:hypothetical protein
VMKLVQNDKMELADAFHKVTEDALAEQEAQQEGGQMTPEQLTAGPTLQAMAGQQAPIQEPQPAQRNLADMLMTLRRGAGV